MTWQASAKYHFKKNKEKIHKNVVIGIVNDVRISHKMKNKS